MAKVWFPSSGTYAHSSIENVLRGGWYAWAEHPCVEDVRTMLMYEFEFYRIVNFDPARGGWDVPKDNEGRPHLFCLFEVTLPGSVQYTTFDDGYVGLTVGEFNPNEGISPVKCAVVRPLPEPSGPRWPRPEDLLKPWRS